MATSPDKKGFAGSWTTYGIAIGLTVLACAVAVILRLFTSTDLPFQTFAALIGVIITAIITGVLLKGQSDAERRQKEQSEIFKEKLATYNRFLDALCKYVTETTESNKKELIFHAMAIRMHCSPDMIDEFDNHVTRLLKGTGENTEFGILVDSLNNIACLFRTELYGEQGGVNSKKLNDFVEAIAGSQEEPTEQQKRLDAAADEKEDAETVGKSPVAGWDCKIKDLKSQGWTLTEGDDSFKLSSDGVTVEISVYRKKGKYIVEAVKEGDNDFSQSLKNNFKGARRYGTWWRELPISNYGVTEGSLVQQLPTNDRARASVIKWIDKITAFAKNYNQMQ